MILNGCNKQKGSICNKHFINAMANMVLMWIVLWDKELGPALHGTLPRYDSLALEVHLGKVVHFHGYIRFTSHLRRQKLDTNFRTDFGKSHINKTYPEHKSRCLVVILAFKWCPVIMRKISLTYFCSHIKWLSLIVTHLVRCSGLFWYCGWNFVSIFKTSEWWWWLLKLSVSCK